MPAYDPPSDLVQFLRSGTPPIYIGFGSIVIDDPTHLTNVIIESIKSSGVRAIISRGWSSIGAAEGTDSIFYLDDCPHEWLFPKVSAVIHHGGAGTTACGLLNGRPTVIVPFFGDQPFWGRMIRNARAGPSPIPYRSLNSQSLADGIRYCLTAQAIAAASDIASRMRNENGVKQAAALFHKQLPSDRLDCEIVPQQSATWLYTRWNRSVRLSNLAVERLCLAQDLKFKRKHLQQ